MSGYYYFTTRNAAKTSFTALITSPVEGQNEFYIAPDLSNVLAMVILALFTYTTRRNSPW